MLSMSAINLRLKSFAWKEIVQYLQSFNRHKVDQGHSKKPLSGHYTIHVIEFDFLKSTSGVMQ